MAVRGIRGAISAKDNSKEAIIKATEELLEKIVEANQIKVEDVASAIFSTTKDLNAAFPAEAARNLGWLYSPLLCTNEIDVPNGLKKCVRVLLHVNMDKPQSEIKHVYLGAAEKLRPDLGKKSEYYLS
ncbi:MAG: chorismate mutase [Candidatus Margulisbacteria bacterium]|nr:chorismate mutase [Candidatus Margulisiibacteriota bacterium]MBU1022056.1 chorismate mutase [Candidatus Margulisiibacteriota bacterium]MBU1729651.1 chorismate mutase [Candidatus Margulisiibacteriota bacterium]MBU1954971.1 chorismate mutase [Candidatus Margulisiibacteriota bacterium]